MFDAMWSISLSLEVEERSCGVCEGLIREVELVEAAEPLSVPGRDLTDSGWDFVTTDSGWDSVTTDSGWDSVTTDSGWDSVITDSDWDSVTTDSG